MNKLNDLLMRIISSSRWIIVINLGLCGMVGYSVVELLLASPTINLVQRISHNRLLSQLNQTQPVAKVTLDISVLKPAYLFGKSPEISTNLATDTQPLPQTHLDLKLHGIYYSSNRHTSLAMIADSLDKTNLYHTNESLPGGVILHEIHEKHVTLLRNGQIEILNLLDSNNPTPITTITSYAKNAQNVPNTDKLSPEQLLGHYQHQLQTDPNSLMKLIRILPINQGGRLIGYQLNPGKNTNLLNRFNLQAGDILTSINGIKLDNPINGLNAIQPLANAEQINLEVLRNQQSLSFAFNVEK
jgi:general secretion pathway protein C